jgi:RNAse (barnase) inhibitor barstar
MSRINNVNTSYYTKNKTRVVFIDGNYCDTIDKCYSSLIQQLSIPDYFGHNLDALEEIIADLEWVEEEKIEIVVLNKDALLQNDLPLKNDFLDIICNNDNLKIEVYLLTNNE